MNLQRALLFFVKNHNSKTKIRRNGQRRIGAFQALEPRLAMCGTPLDVPGDVSTCFAYRAENSPEAAEQLDGLTFAPPEWVEVQDGRVIVHGTDGDDVITLRPTDDGVRIIRNGDVRVVNSPHLSGPTRLEVLAGDGDDHVTIKNPITEFAHVMVQGEGGNDRLQGSDGAETLFGGAGDDKLFGDGGNDRLFGGTGNDYLKGGTGNDRLAGGAGDDQLWGERGSDRLYGGSGNDRMLGGVGDDRLWGQSGADQVLGGAGDDFLSGGRGDDRLEGQGENDALMGGKGDDRLYGGKGDDRLVSRDGVIGNDYVHGGIGDNTYHAPPSEIA